MRAKKVRDEREHVIHLRVAGLVGRLPRRHRVGAHPEAFDPSIDELIGLVERDVIVDKIAEMLRDLRGKGFNTIGEARIERSRAAAGGLNVQRPGVVHERDDRRDSGSAKSLQNVTVVGESFVTPNAGLRLESCPRKREPEYGAAEPARELDILSIAVPEIRRVAARDDSAHTLPDVANLVASIVRLALMIGRRYAEAKVLHHRVGTASRHRSSPCRYMEEMPSCLD